MRKRFLSIGECMVEMAPTADGTYRLGYAGDTLNTAWYARRALGDGWGVAYYTAVGDDPISRQMSDFIAGAGIDTGFIRRLADRTVGLYMIQLDKGERSFAYWRSQSAARLLAADPAPLARALAAADLVYFSGISLAILSPGHRAALMDAVTEARRNGATVAFDPNLRPKLWESADTMRQAITAAAGISDLVLPSFDDEAAAFGDAGPEATAERYSAAGARRVIVKNGAGEMVSLGDDGLVRFTPDPVADIIDTTAAGDSFNAGFLAEYLETGSLETAMAAGAALAARVIRHRGALVE